MAHREDPSLRTSSRYPQDLKRAQETAYRLLSYKPRSRKELIERLGQKGFLQDVIEEVIRRLEAEGYIDDEAYGQGIAKSLIQRRLLGKEALRSELSKRGLEREITEKIIEDSYAGREEGDLAFQALERKWRTLREKPIEVAKRRASDYLRRKGFSFGVIRKVLMEKFEI